MTIEVDTDNNLLAVRTETEASSEDKRQIALAFATLAGQLGPGPVQPYVQLTQRQDGPYEQVWKLSSLCTEKKRQDEMRSLRRAIYVMNTGIRGPRWHEPE